VENVVCVNNVPVIPEEKYGKLETVLKKTFGKVGNVLDIHMPLDASSSMTKGFCFVEYEDSEQVCIPIILARTWIAGGDM
jgi:translation initiation factor 3 subunit B